MGRLKRKDAARSRKAVPQRKRTYRLRRQGYGDTPVLLKERRPGDREAQVARLAKEKTEWAERASQLQDMLLRARSDLENFRRRTQREREEVRATLTADLLLVFLPVLDHFDLAVRAAATNSDPASILQGVEMIHRELQGVLQSVGLEAIVEASVPFDPAIHEAVATESRPEVEDRLVLEVLRPGWRFGARCLRPAMVKVNRVAESAPSTPPLP